MAMTPRPDPLATRPWPIRGRVTRRPRAAAWLLLAIALLLGGMAPSAAQDFPPLTGRVVDTADLLDPGMEAALTDKLAAFEAQSSDQVVVATVPDLQGYDIADYANRLARQWAIGQKDEDNGVLLLVSRDDRKVRIEVGYGLEGTLTDALSTLVIQNDILPAFRSGDYPAGIAKGVDGILQVLSGDAAELEARAKRNESWSGNDVSGWLFTLFFVGVWIFVLGSFVMTNLARRRGQKIGKNRYRWLGMIWALNAAGSSRRSGRGGFSGGGSFGGGGFSGGGGSFGGGGSSGSW